MRGGSSHDQSALPTLGPGDRDEARFTSNKTDLRRGPRGVVSVSSVLTPILTRIRLPNYCFWVLDVRTALAPTVVPEMENVHVFNA